MKMDAMLSMRLTSRMCMMFKRMMEMKRMCSGSSFVRIRCLSGKHAISPRISYISSVDTEFVQTHSRNSIRIVSIINASIMQTQIVKRVSPSSALREMMLFFVHTDKLPKKATFTVLVNLKGNYLSSIN